MNKLGDKFQINYGNKLGKGAFGDVFLGLSKAQGCYVAIKRIHSSAPETIKLEINIMKKFNHQNILRLIDVVVVGQEVYIISEYCEAGNLTQEIETARIPELNVFSYLKQLVLGMAVIQQSKHMHRDIKPDNILFTSDKVIKICDFGVARRIIGDDPIKMEKFSLKGTPYYTAPQVMNSEEYSIKCDVWSAGVLLVEMLTSKNPFESALNQVALKGLQKGILNNGLGYYTLSSEYHPWFKFIVSKMMAFHEKDRWCFEQIKEEMLKNEARLMQELRTGKRVEIFENPETSSGGSMSTRAEIMTAAKSIQHKNMVLNKKKPTIKIVGDEGMSLEQRARIQNQNKNKLGDLKAYTDYVYARGRLFADGTTKYFESKENPKPMPLRCLLLFLGLMTYTKHIQTIQRILYSTEKVILPNEVTIRTTGLEPSNVERLEKIRIDYQKDIHPEIQKFHPTIVMIHKKLNSENYKAMHAEILKKNKHILELINDAKDNRCQRSADHYEMVLKEFFEEQCLENVEGLKEEFLRVYYWNLLLCFTKVRVPLSKFKDNKLVNIICESISKLPVQKVKQGVEGMHSQIVHH